MCDLSFCWQRGRPLDIQTDVFDITDLTSPLPRCHYAVAADLLYQKSTAVALAKRCAEALRSPECEGVIVGDLGRPGRDAFLQTLVVGRWSGDAKPARASPVRCELRNKHAHDGAISSQSN